jgi:hypothetical protein
MNARIERAVNSENLGARITENRTLNQKIWVEESFSGKTVFSGVFWGNSGIWSGWRVLVQTTVALAKFGDF